MLTFPMIVVLTLEVKTLVGNVTNDCSAGVCETVVDSVVVCNGNVLVLLGVVTVSIVILKVSEPIVFEVFTNCSFRVTNDVVVVIVEGAVVVVVVVVVAVILFAECRVVLVLGLSIVVSVAGVCVGV